MRAAVIGTGWGLVHVDALGQLGVEVVALCGTDLTRTRAIADDHGIAFAFDDVAHLPDLGLDLITIASPTSTHAQLVGGLGPTPLLCEKPAVGVDTAISDVPTPTGPVWVNYAFGFLDVATQADALLLQGSSLGEVTSAQVRSDYDLGGLVVEPRNPWQWFTDVASHPWSWAVSRFGQPVGPVEGGTQQPQSGSASAAQLSYVSQSGVPVTVVASPVTAFNGLRHRVRITAERGSLEFAGQFRLGQAWEFGPVLLNGEPQSLEQGFGAPAYTDQGGSSKQHPRTDPWHRANVASIAAVVNAARTTEIDHRPRSLAQQWAPGNPAAANGKSDPPQPFTWEQALAMDAHVQRVAHL